MHTYLSCHLEAWRLSEHHAHSAGRLMHDLLHLLPKCCHLPVHYLLHIHYWWRLHHLGRQVCLSCNVHWWCLCPWMFRVHGL